MQQQVVELLSDYDTLSFWAKVLLPIVGSQAISQIWKLWHRDTYGKKPKGYMVATVSAIVCGVIVALVMHAFPAEGKAFTWEQSIVGGLMLGPASPLLWFVGSLIAGRFMPSVGRAMRGGQRRKRPRNPEDVWTDEEREERTLFGDTTMFQIRDQKDE